MNNSSKIKIIKPSYVYFLLQLSITKSLSQSISAGAFLFFILISFQDNIFSSALVLILLIIGLFIVLLLVNALVNYVIYQKTYYEIHEDRIIQNTGGLFSDSKNEMLIKNITSISKVEPFLMRFFGLAKIVLDSAGSADDTITIYGVSNPTDSFQMIIEKMKINGYKMKNQKIIGTRRTSTTMIYLNLFVSPIALLATAIFSFLFITTVPSEIEPSYILGTLLFLIVFVLVPGFIGIIMQYFDLKNRQYYVYDDGVEFYEGFFNKVQSILPMEKISDSKRIQGLLGRIFNYATFHISTVGSGKDVEFNFIPDAELLSSQLNDQFEEFRFNSKAENIEIKDDNLNDSDEAFILSKDFKMQEDIFDRNDFKLTFKPELLKSSVGWLIALPFACIMFFLLPIWVIGFISSLIIKLSTTYSIEKGNFVSSFKFINIVEKKANIDKITTVIVKRTILDRILGLCTIKLISLGTAENIIFRNIRFDKDLILEIKIKVGLNIEKIDKQISTQFSLKLFLIKNIFSLIGIFFILIVLFILSVALTNSILLFLVSILFFVILIGTLYISEKLAFSNKILSFHSNGIQFEKGFWIIEETSVRFRNIKGVTTVIYPTTEYGSVILNIAGEEFIQSNTKSKNGQYALKSISIFAPYFPNIKTIDEQFDFILIYRNTGKSFEEIQKLIDGYSPKILAIEKRSFLPSVLRLAILFIGLCFIFPVYILVAMGIILEVYFTEYQIEGIRILKKSGVFFKTQHSIIFSRIDFIGKNEDFIGKLTSTGNISINTVGGSATEMTLVDVKNFNELYSLLKEKYRK